MPNRLADLAAGRYPGGKNARGTWQWIVSYFLEHTAYVEPFAGSYGIGKRKLPALSSIAIDSDPEVCRYLQTLPGVQVLCQCGIAWLEANADLLGPETLVYCDPPYPLGTRKNRRYYRHEWTDQHHGRFLAIANRLRCPCLISTYKNPAYSLALVDWHVETRMVTTRGRGKLQEEFLFMNFDPLQARYIWGESIEKPAIGPPEGNWRRRQRIQRLIGRWVADFEKRPEDERRAVLSALLESEKKRRSGVTVATRGVTP